MELQPISSWTGQIGTVVLGATRAEGGSRSVAYTIGGERDLPFIGSPPSGHRPLVVYEICDDPAIWPPVVREFLKDRTLEPGTWAREAGNQWKPDLIRLVLTSTRKRDFKDFTAIRNTVEEVLQQSPLPLIIEGSTDPSIDSEVFAACGEAGEGERLLLGTAEAGRYRSIAAAALAYGHAVIAQSPIDINLAKQLNILLRETGVPADRIVIDPYTGALGYGFEYSFSVMERIRTSALKGDTDLAMPIISSAPDTLTVREVREADEGIRQRVAVHWEFSTALASVFAGASMAGVRHPQTIPLLRGAIDALWGGAGVR
jgi:acetyl-CoA decarbonylase/synthase complex subunit delta